MYALKMTKENINGFTNVAYAEGDDQSQTQETQETLKDILPSFMTELNHENAE